MTTIQALSSYKHAEHFNKRVVAKAGTETTEDKEAAQQDTATVVKEIQAKQAQEKPVQEKPTTPAVAKPVKKVAKK